MLPSITADPVLAPSTVGRTRGEPNRGHWLALGRAIGESLLRCLDTVHYGHPARYPLYVLDSHSHPQELQQRAHRLKFVRTMSDELMERHHAHCVTHGAECFNQWGPSTSWLRLLALQQLG